MSLDVGEMADFMPLTAAAASHVLIIDDDELLLERLRDLLTTAGFEVSVAHTATEALQILERTFIPIVISDLQMPGMSGLTLCRTIRARSWPGYVYVMLLTIRDIEADIVAGFGAGADDYLSKGASPEHFLARLRSAQRILALESSLKYALAERASEALTDSLSGAPNNRYFSRRLTKELNDAQTSGVETSLMLIDIDHFKGVNDRYGHAAGDAVLRETVRRFMEVLRTDSQWCARLGGDEFVVVLAGTSLDHACDVAETLRQSVTPTIHTAAGPIELTISIGVTSTKSFVHLGEATVEALCRQADKHLYVSKGQGRNRITADVRPEPLRQHHTSEGPAANHNPHANHNPPAGDHPPAGHNPSVFEGPARAALADEGDDARDRQRLIRQGRKFLARTLRETRAIQVLIERVTAGEPAPALMTEIDAISHRIHGTAATLGFPDVSHRARQVERAAQGILTADVSGIGVGQSDMDCLRISNHVLTEQVELSLATGAGP